MTSLSETAGTSLEEGLYRKVTWRIIPLLFFSYVVGYLDRVNIGFAKLQMMGDLGWSDTVYGLGAGIFFLGYFLFEIPSNLILHRIGARRWIGLIMITWGIVSAAMLLVKTATVFYVFRFALGFAESGLFPGIVLYLTYWYPPRRRAQMGALFMVGIPFSGVIGGPLSGWISGTLSLGGLAGWQWLFLLEGIPSVVMGCFILALLQDSIRGTPWLSEGEKDMLERNLAAAAPAHSHLGVGKALLHPRVWLLSAIYFTSMMGLYGIGFWLPQLIKNTGVRDLFEVGLLTAIPYGVAAVAMIAMSRHADRIGEKRWHLIAAGWAGAIGLIASGLFAGDTALAMIALSLATAGVLTTMPLFWTLPSEFLGGAATAAGIGLINSVGNLAGFVSPYMVGAIVDATHKTALGLYVIAGGLILGSLLVFIATRSRSPGAVSG